jgi:multiple sugar transport system permease protein
MCSFGIFSKIALPLSKSGLFAAGLLVFIYNWNEFIFALVTTSVKARTATVALTGFVTNDSSVFWGELSALGFFMTIPVIIFALIFNKVLMRGVFAGAIKG